MSAPTSDLVVFAGIFCKLWHIPTAGTVAEAHTHTWDHLTLIMSGRVRMFSDGAELGEFAAPAVIRIMANKQHWMTALTDNVTVACVHAVGEAERE